MLSILKSTTNGNGHVDAMSGRRRAYMKLTRQQLISSAADVVCGRVPYVPSLKETSMLFGVPVAQIRDELKARSAASDDLEAARLAEQRAAEVARWDDQIEAEMINVEADALVAALRGAAPEVQSAVGQILCGGSV
jgi:hypothetical protein